MSNYKHPTMYLEKEVVKRNEESPKAKQQSDMLELAQRLAADGNNCKFRTSPRCTFVLHFVSLILFLVLCLVMPCPSTLNAYQPAVLMNLASVSAGDYAICGHQY